MFFLKCPWNENYSKENDPKSSQGQTRLCGAIHQIFPEHCPGLPQLLWSILTGSRPTSALGFHILFTVILRGLCVGTIVIDHTTHS